MSDPLQPMGPLFHMLEEAAEHREPATKHINVTQPVIDVPEWMNPEYDYTVVWNEAAGEWRVIPF